MEGGMDPFSTLADLVIERPGRAKVLDRLGLDYCCRGRRTLDEACRGSGLDAKRVLAEIIAGDDEPDAEPAGIGEGLAALCDSIERTHHAFLRETLPRVSALGERVERTHAARDPRLTRLAQVIAAFRKSALLPIVDQCVVAHCERKLTAVDAAKAKWWTAKVQNDVLDACVQLHGGYGYMNEYRVARAWRDARVTKIWAGSNEIMKELIGRDLGL